MSVAPSSSRPARLAALDALRAVGAAAVVGTHVGFNTGATGQGVWGGFLARLDVGVAIFFVLSGFLLFRPFAYAAATGAGRPDIARYLWRRALRILPAYWLAVAACLTVLPQNAPASASDWARYGTLSQIYFQDWNRHGLSQTWSLSTEVAFYVLLPLVAIGTIGRRWRPVRTLALTVAIGLIATAGWLVGMGIGPLATTTHETWLPTFAIWFSAGMALAVIHVALRVDAPPARWRVLDELASAPLTCCVVALGLLGLASTPITGPRDLSPTTATELGVRVVLFAGVAVMLMIPAAFGPPTRFKAALDSAPARWLGKVSYGLFLWHLLVLELIYLVEDRPLFTGDLLGTYLMTLGGGLLLASASYYLLEQPLQRWGARPRRRADDHGQPQRTDGEKASGLGAGRHVVLLNGQRKPAA